MKTPLLLANHPRGIVPFRSLPPLLALLAAFVLSPAGSLSAQPAGPAPDPAQDVPVVLSPFIVVAEKDEGFVAAATLAGGRLATNLRDTPLAYSVLTREFLDALNLFDTEQAMSWAVGAYLPKAEVTGYRYFNQESGSSVVSRGINTRRPQRNFFQLGFNSDNYSEDRVDFARGPNALLIGTTGLGGSVITMTKRARTDSSFGSASAVVGSWDMYRATLDYNAALSDQFAVRVNALWQDSGTWRDLEFSKREGIHLAATYRPTDRTAIRVEYENFTNEVMAGRESMEDRVSGWDGVTVVPAPTATVAGSTERGLTRLGSATSEYLVFIPGQDAGTVTNFANTWTTVGGAASPVVPVAGVLALSTANLDINGGSLIGDTSVGAYDPAGRLRLALAGSPHLRIPGRRTVTGPTSPTLVYKFNSAAAYFEHQQGQHVFFEIGAHRAETSKLSNYIMARAINEIFLDVTQTLPTGGTNPNFLQPFSDSFNSEQYFDDSYLEGRAAIAVVFDNTSWGSFRGNVIAGKTRSESRIYRKAYVFNRHPDIRRRSASDVYRFRYYFNNPAPLTVPESINLVDPIAGTTVRYDVDTVIDLNSTTNNRGADIDYEYLQAAFNAKLWDGRINLLVGARHDAYKQENLSVIGNAAALFNDYPANWDGQTLIFRPSAPADYWTMTFVPKNAAGAPTGPAQLALSRPRTAGVPQPQYAGDRFRDDYSAPAVDFDVTSISYGGVVHVLPWLSAYGNFAQTYVPPLSGLTLTGSAVPAGIGEGWDAGLRFNFLDGRIVASIGYYDGEESNDAFDSTGSTRKYADIAAANAIGDLSATGMNTRGLPLLPTPTFDFRDRKASGIEVDLVANITREWRMTFNYSEPETLSTNEFQDEWAYLRANESTLRQIVLDAGGLIDAGGVATVDVSVPVGNRSPDVAAAVAGWNSIQTFKRTNDPTASVIAFQPTYTANFFTDYRFSSGPLKGLRLGLGVQAFGERPVGNRGADTIINPANPNLAIDDPNVDINTLVIVPSYYSTTATIGYEYQFKNKMALNLNLSITNLLDEDELIYTWSTLRPPGGDIRRPDRVGTPVAFIYHNPRRFTLSARLSF